MKCNTNIGNIWVYRLNLHEEDFCWPLRSTLSIRGKISIVHVDQDLLSVKIWRWTASNGFKETYQNIKYLPSKMLDQGRQYGKHRLFITSVKAGERNLFSRDPSVGCFASSNPSLMKLMKNLDKDIAPFGKTICSSLPQSISFSFWNIPGVVNANRTTC